MKETLTQSSWSICEALGTPPPCKGHAKSGGGGGNYSDYEEHSELPKRQENQSSNLNDIIGDLSQVNPGLNQLLQEIY